MKLSEEMLKACYDGELDLVARACGRAWKNWITRNHRDADGSAEGC